MRLLVDYISKGEPSCHEQLNEKVIREKGTDDLYRVRGSTIARAMARESLTSSLVFHFRFCQGHMVIHRDCYACFHLIQFEASTASRKN